MIFWLTLPFLISQILAGIAIVTDIVSFQFKERKHIILFFIVAGVCMGLHYFLLARYVAAALVAIWIVRFICSYYSTQWYWKYIFITLFAIATAFFYKDYYDLLIFAAMSISTVSSFRKDDYSLRVLMMLATAVAILYNILILSPIGTTLQVVFLVSNFIGYYRFYYKKIESWKN